MAHRQIKGQNYWPGFVDALSNLVLIIILVLIVFTVTLFYFASQVGVKVAATAQTKATEVVAKAVHTIEQAPKEVQKPIVKDSEEEKKVTKTMAAAAKLLEQINKDLTPQQKRKFQRKIDVVSDQITANVNAGEVDESSEANRINSTAIPSNTTKSTSGRTDNPKAGATNNVSDAVKLNSTTEPSDVAKLNAGEAQEPSDLTTKSELEANKKVATTPKGGGSVAGSSRLEQW